MTCKEHKWRPLYYRKPNTEKNSQDWIKLKDRVICETCEKIAEIKI